MPSCTVPRCSGKPRCGQRLSTAAKRPSCENTAIGRSAPGSTVTPFFRSSSTVATRSHSVLLSSIMQLLPGLRQGSIVQDLDGDPTGRAEKETPRAVELSGRPHIEAVFTETPIELIHAFSALQEEPDV